MEEQAKIVVFIPVSNTCRAVCGLIEATLDDVSEGGNSCCVEPVFSEDDFDKTLSAFSSNLKMVVVGQKELSKHQLEIITRNNVFLLILFGEESKLYLDLEESISSGIVKYLKTAEICPA